MGWDEMNARALVLIQVIIIGIVISLLACVFLEQKAALSERKRERERGWMQQKE